MLHFRRLFILLILSIVWLVPGRIVAADSSFPDYNVPASTQDYSLELTILPNYARHSLTLAGKLDDEDTDCADRVSGLLPGLSLANKQFYVSYVPPENLCQFFVPQIGDIEAVTGTANTYTLSLPWKDFHVLGKDSSVIVSVFAADVTELHNGDQTLKIAPDGYTWQIDGPVKSLDATVQPWVINADINLTDVLGAALRDHLDAKLLLSGSIKISNIHNLDGYYKLIGRDNNKDAKLIPSDIAQVLLDYPFYQSTGTYPGFNFFTQYYDKQNLTRETRLNAKVVSHGLVQDATTNDVSGEINLSVTGYQQLISPQNSLTFNCPSFVPPDPNEQPSIQNTLQITFCVWLGPQDSLTLRIPNGLIVETSSPPNEQTTDTLVYRGAGQFEVKIYYNPLALNIGQQYLFLARVYSILWEPYLIVLPIIGFFAFILLRASGRIALHYKFLLLPPIILIVGGLFIHYAGSSTALLLLALIVLFPELKVYEHTISPRIRPLLSRLSIKATWFYGIDWRDLAAYFVVIVIILVINAFAGRGDTVAGQEQLQARAPLLILLLIGSVAAIYYPFAARGKRREHILNLHRDRLPAYATFFLVAATYDVFDQSILSLIILITAIFVLMLYQWHIDKKHKRAKTSRHVPAAPPQGTPPVSAPPVQGTPPMPTPAVQGTHDDPQAPAASPVAEDQAKQQALTSPTLVEDDQDQGQDPASTSKENEISKRWSRHLGDLLGSPGALIAIILIALIAISPGMTSLGGIVYTLTTFIGSALLFASLYDFLPGQGLVKALVYSIPLWLIFVFGIGTSDRGLNLLNDPSIDSIAMRYALYFQQFPALLVGRVVFYLTVPLLVALFIEFKERQKLQPPGEQGFTFRSSLSDFQSKLTLGSAVLSALVPSLYTLATQQPAITTLVDVLGKLTNGG